MSSIQTAESRLEAGTFDSIPALAETGWPTSGWRNRETILTNECSTETRFTNELSVQAQ